MILDTSALLAILLTEPERPAMLAAIIRSSKRQIGAPNWLDACMVLEGRSKPDGNLSLQTLRTELRIDIVPFDAGLAEIAYGAFQRSGRRRHPAKLNYGDCMAYALARATGEPLQFKGEDFSQTDIPAALA